ncbi:MAG: DUF4174 domain-containing protein [Blastochloris sp.]|nr:DUF4174 domain-containing protein [Blastochloris sp.]
MMALLLLSAGLVLSPELTIPPDSVQELKALRWEKRPLLIFAPEAGHPEYLRLLKNLEASAPALRERDVVLRHHFPGSRHPKLRQHFRVAPDQFCAILLGRDGFEKNRWNQAFSLQELTARIDAMPMGREEAAERVRTQKPPHTVQH